MLAARWIGVTCGSRHHRVIALNLSSMDLTGTIPSQLGNLSFLVSLNIRYNSFHGSLPFELTNLHRLRHLNFGKKSFSGELCGVIPSSLGNLSKLEQLVLYNNHFKGQLPISIGNLSNLKWLYLHNNSFSEMVTENLASSGVAGASFLMFIYSLDYAQIHLANDAKSTKKGGERQFNDLYFATKATEMP
ncbi:hypothetical protein V6N12_057416 [Hibiscus sabdariffa]|uniref:Disease resistance R13L4/SHOC-2-like LRR domain-containing protein n=1 Tax=Hibiscus sabdariffa TaxID=183260 RepID=A0ABR2C6G5_9ROSI